MPVALGEGASPGVGASGAIVHHSTASNTTLASPERATIPSPGCALAPASSLHVGALPPFIDQVFDGVSQRASDALEEEADVGGDGIFAV